MAEGPEGTGMSAGMEGSDEVGLTGSERGAAALEVGMAFAENWSRTSSRSSKSGSESS